VSAPERFPSTQEPAGAVLVSISPAMQEVRDLALRVAPGTAKVLITGESGVGKDLVARFVHAHSNRARAPFVAVNCGAVSETLLESELFGHVRGSFTGAYRDKPGKLEQAHRGTIFLDEVGEMSLRMQVTLLRFLENGEIQRVGADGGSARVDVRVVAATNQDLPALVATGKFRDDLLYRLRVAHIHVPPLRERREEIRALIQHTMAGTLGAGGRAITFSEEALDALEAYRWPGNVRELQNLVESLVWTSAADRIEVEHLPAGIQGAVTGRVVPTQERRRQLADDLYAALVSGSISFWTHVHPMFLNRDLTRHDLRELVRRGLAQTGGNYRALLKLFGIDEGDYKRFLNFLATHDCSVDYRAYRNGAMAPPPSSAPRPLIFNPEARGRRNRADGTDNSGA
jgi:DNA-binding NtrC family response regulator